MLDPIHFATKPPFYPQSSRYLFFGRLIIKHFSMSSVLDFPKRPMHRMSKVKRLQHRARFICARFREDAVNFPHFVTSI